MHYFGWLWFRRPCFNISGAIRATFLSIKNPQFFLRFQYPCLRKWSKIRVIPVKIERLLKWRSSEAGSQAAISQLAFSEINYSEFKFWSAKKQKEETIQIFGGRFLISRKFIWNLFSQGFRFFSLFFVNKVFSESDIANLDRWFFLSERKKTEFKLKTK